MAHPRHQLFERFVIDELVPWIRQDCHTPNIRVAVSGCSLGAFYAANFALKFPEEFPYALCMSGRYEMRHFTDGFQNGDVYFNNPLAYVAGMDGAALERVRERPPNPRLRPGRLGGGLHRGDQALADLLQAKGISHSRDIWGRDVSHQWPWWRRQARYHLGRLVA